MSSFAASHAHSASIPGANGLRLGELLVQEGLVKESGVSRALKLQSAVGGHLGTNLLELGSITEGALLNALGKQRLTPTVNRWDLLDVGSDVINLIPPKLAKRYEIVPFKREGQRLFIASMRPGEILVEDEVGTLTSCLTRTFIGLEIRVREALERHYLLERPLRLAVLARRLDPKETGQTSSASLASGDDGGTVVEVLPAIPSDEELARLGTANDLWQAAAAPVETTADLGFDDDGIDVEVPAAAIDTLSVEQALRAIEPLAPPTSAASSSAPAEATDEEAESRSRWTPPAASKASAAGTGVASEPADVLISWTPEERLEAANAALQQSEIRDEIADAILEYCAPYLRRRLLLIHREGQVVGWRGEGDGVGHAGVREIGFCSGAPSVFLTLLKGARLWRGPLPLLEAHQTLYEGLGGALPKECVVLPIALRSKVVCFLYGDNLDAGLEGVPITALERLIAKAGVAFEVCILRNKLRTL